jgi:hypothetical protein
VRSAWIRRIHVSDHLDAPGLKPPHGEARIDIIDEQLAILTKGKAPSQGVKPHSDTLTDMPYLGAPH